MPEIFSKIENLVILYGPTVLMFATQIIEWIVTLRRFSLLSIKAQIKPVLDKYDSIAEELKKYKDDVDKLRDENIELLNKIREDQVIQEKVKEMLAESNEYMKALSQENVELKAELRRKVCEAKEPENV